MLTKLANETMNKEYYWYLKNYDKFFHDQNKCLIRIKLPFCLLDPSVQGASPSYQDGDVARKMGLNVSPKYKGFYRYGAN